MRFTCLFLFLFCSVLLSAPATEQQMIAAIRLNSYSEREKGIEAAFESWIGAKDPTSQTLLLRFLTSDELHGNRSINSDLREKAIEKILLSGNPEHLPAALAYCRAKGDGRKLHRKVVDAIVLAIPKNPALAQTITNGISASPTHSAVKLDGLVQKGSLQLRPNFDATLLSRAIHQAGSIPAGTKMNFGAEASQGVTFNEKLLDLTLYPAVAAAEMQGGKNEYFNLLMQVRGKLSFETIPTREEFTRELHRVMETAPPEIRLAIAQKVRDSMVSNVRDPNYSTFVRPAYEQPPPKVFRTLTIDNRDGADMSLARFLLNQPVEAADPRDAKGEKLAGLNDVEMIHFAGSAEKSLSKRGPSWIRSSGRSANFSPYSYIQPAPGRTIAETLAPQNYIPAVHEVGDEGGRPPNAFWRHPDAYDVQSGWSTKLSFGSTPCKTVNAAEASVQK